MPPDIDCDLDQTSTGTLRQLVRRLLNGHTDVSIDDALLVADELASNALRHGETPRYCRLWLLDHGRGLRIEVTDSGPGQPRIITPDTIGGRGLRLVDRLASRWGVRRHGVSKTVWAEIDAEIDNANGSGNDPTCDRCSGHDHARYALAPYVRARARHAAARGGTRPKRRCEFRLLGTEAVSGGHRAASVRRRRALSPHNDRLGCFVAASGPHAETIFDLHIALYTG